MGLHIRRATPDEAEKLTAIAYAAKRNWGYPEEWITQWKSELTITRDFVEDNEVFAATINGGIVGCCALIFDGGLAEIEHMWIEPDFMGAGVGRALFTHARRRAEKLGAQALELSADPYAEGFYKRMGARRIGEVRADIGGQSRVLPRMRIEL